MSDESRVINDDISPLTSTLVIAYLKNTRGMSCVCSAIKKHEIFFFFPVFAVSANCLWGTSHSGLHLFNREIVPFHFFICEDIFRLGVILLLIVFPPLGSSHKSVKFTVLYLIQAL